MTVLRSSRVDSCPTCHAKVITGLDSDYCGLPVTVDHSPVDQIGELLAVLDGRKTYDHRPGSHRAHTRQLEPRNHVRISNSLQMWPIHPEHRCGQPLPPAAAKPSPNPSASLTDPTYQHPEGLPF